MVRTITDFRELNKQIVRRPYPIPKISTTLQELEGFTYTMALDLNMGYYTIRLDPQAVEMFTIIFPVGTLPDGYVHNVPLPRVPHIIQSAMTETGSSFRVPNTGKHLPGYFGLPVGIPTLGSNRTCNS